MYAQFYLFHRRKKSGTMKTNSGGMNRGRRANTVGALLTKQKSTGKYSPNKLLRYNICETHKEKKVKEEDGQRNRDKES